jgi:hypothetical protein
MTGLMHNCMRCSCVGADAAVPQHVLAAAAAEDQGPKKNSLVLAVCICTRAPGALGLIAEAHELGGEVSCSAYGRGRHLGSCSPLMCGPAAQEH